jgi:hypothetical protein
MTSSKLNSSLGSLACCGLNEGTMAPFHFLFWKSILCLLVALFVCIPVQKCKFRDKFYSGLPTYCHLDTNCVMGCPKFWFQVLHPYLHASPRLHELSIVGTHRNSFQLFVTTNGVVWHLLINSHVKVSTYDSVGLFSEKITVNKLLTVSSLFLGLISRDMKIQSTGSDT